ncbi:hypothetical protein Hanom_Chr10g00919801 [Helianthus anomalus]
MMTSRPPLWVAALDGDDTVEHQPSATKIADKHAPHPPSLFVPKEKNNHLSSGGGTRRLKSEHKR